MEYYFKGFLYKGKNSETFNTSRNNPTWFALNEETIDKYGKVKYKVEIAEHMKLLNISTWEFRNDLFSKFNSFSLLDNSLRRKKAFTLIALGLPDLETQTHMMQRYLSKIPPHYNDPNIVIDTCTLTGHRLSEHTLDLEMVNMLKLLYGHEYIGYIQPTRIASRWMNEFASEVCLFDLTKVKFGHIVKMANTQKGGSTMKDSVWYKKLNDLMCTPNEFEAMYKDTMHGILRYDGYSEQEIALIKTLPNEKERREKRATSHDFADPIVSNLSFQDVKLDMKFDHTITLKPE